MSDNGWISGVKGYVAAFRRGGEQLRKAEDVETIRGIEGTAARAWFEVFGKSLPSGWEWHGRSYHPPRDEVNALLSFFYGLESSELESLCRQHGLDPE